MHIVTGKGIPIIVMLLMGVRILSLYFDWFK